MDSSYGTKPACWCKGWADGYSCSLGYTEAGESVSMVRPWSN